LLGGTAGEEVAENPLGESAPRALKARTCFQQLNGTSKRLKRNSPSTQNATTGLKPALILGALRGAEVPLFHGAARICAARICEFFRNH